MSVKKIVCFYSLFALSAQLGAMFDYFKFWNKEESKKPLDLTVRSWGEKKNCAFQPSSEEQKYQQLRRNHTQKAIEKLLSKAGIETEKIKKYPRIALAGSGGGMRAMLAFDAALLRLYRDGLLDSIDYISTLSGSTWALAPWLVSGEPQYPIFEQGFVAKIQKNAANQFAVGWTNILESFRKGFKHLSVSDTYSGKLARMLFGEHKNWADLTLGSLKKNIDSGQMPLPIFTAIMVPPDLWEKKELPLAFTKETAYSWCEMTPIEAACYDFCAAVPIDSFNSKFVAGKWEASNRKPFDLAKILGLCSSAFAITRGEYNPTAEEAFFGQRRLVARNVGNPVYQLSTCPAKAAIDSETLPIIDAGISFNLPLPPLLHRDQADPLDLIIVIDVTGAIPRSPALGQAKRYATKKGLRFPSLDSKFDYQSKPFTLFGSPDDPNDLLILYVPLVENPMYKAIEQDVQDLFTKMVENEKKKEKDEEEAEFLREKFERLVENNEITESKKYQTLLTRLDIIIKAQSLNNGDYPEAIKFVEKMLPFTFKRASEGMGKFKFVYTPEHIEQLQAIFSVALTEALPTIIDALKTRTQLLNK